MQKTARIFAGNAKLKEGHGKLICSLEGLMRCSTNRCLHDC